MNFFMKGGGREGAEKIENRKVERKRGIVISVFILYVQTSKTNYSTFPLILFVVVTEWGTNLNNTVVFER